MWDLADSRESEVLLPESSVKECCFAGGACPAVFRGLSGETRAFRVMLGLGDITRILENRMENSMEHGVCEKPN